MFTKGIMPTPEESYVRVLYLGKLNPLYKEDRKHPEAKSTPTLEVMMWQIWNEASAFNKANFISGHLSYTASLHVAQLLEGEENAVHSLMSRIRKDPRVVIELELRKKLSTLNVGWEMSMCYSFEVTLPESRLITNNGISLGETFDRMENTYQVRKQKLDVPKFYKHIIDCILLKYVYRTMGNTEFKKITTTKCTVCNVL